MRSFSFLL